MHLLFWIRKICSTVLFRFFFLAMLCSLTVLCFCIGCIWGWCIWGGCWSSFFPFFICWIASRFIVIVIVVVITVIVRGFKFIYVRYFFRYIFSTKSLWFFTTNFCFCFLLVIFPPGVIVHSYICIWIWRCQRRCIRRCIGRSTCVRFHFFHWICIMTRCTSRC